MATNKQQQTISTTDQKNRPTTTTDRIHGTPTPTRHQMLTFKDFVTFLIDKDGQFKEVKEQYDALYYPNAEHWQPYYE